MKRFKTTLATLFLAIAVTIVAAAPGFCADIYFIDTAINLENSEEGFKEAFDEAYKVFEEAGHTILQKYCGFLYNGDSAEILIQAHANLSYTIYAIGGTDKPIVDIEVFDENESIVVRGTDEVGSVYVDINDVEWSGMLTIKTTMVSSKGEGSNYCLIIGYH